MVINDLVHYYIYFVFIYWTINNAIHRKETTMIESILRKKKEKLKVKEEKEDRFKEKNNKRGNRGKSI